MGMVALESSISLYIIASIVAQKTPAVIRMVAHGATYLGLIDHGCS